ncbi:MAG: DHH family phosphoesterase [Bacteroidales bacterium]|nr:DHH family phosphoesterase [Bacteroidales bacterium]
MKKVDVEKAKAAIAKAEKIAIVTHYNPDGDAIGSSLALYNFMENEGKTVDAIIPNRFPDFLEWMPNSEKVLVADGHLSQVKKVLKEADLIFVVDMNAPHRAGRDIENLLLKSKAYKILIDHHIHPEIDCDVMHSCVKTTSASELVYDFLYKHLKYGQDKLSLAIAQCLYVGMITDTGSLTYSCNYPATYRTIEKLIKRGVDGEDIHRKVYDNYSESRMRLLGLLLSQRLKVMPDKATSYTYLTADDMKANFYKDGDTEGFVNYGLSMKGILFTAFFSERGNKIHVSFRSKGTFDVNQFARKHFNGGGHRNAAAADYFDTLENTIAHFENVLKEYEGELY